MAVQRNVLRSVAALAALVLGVLAAAPAPARAQAPRAVLAFLPSGGQDNPDPVIDRLEARPRLALGLLSATQGLYSPQQAMLDMSAGSRTTPSVYEPSDAPELELVVGADRSGFVFGWSKALQRARSALAEISPGMLASAIPGGVAYAGLTGKHHLAAAVAADRGGDVARASLGHSRDLAPRVRRLLRRFRLVVADLPTGDKGDAVLDALLRDRRRGDLLLVMQAPPHATDLQLLPIGAAGVAGGNGALTSTTTHLRGIVAGIDVSVTILDKLGLPVPAGVRGEPMRAEGVRDADALRSIESRLKVVSRRRTPTLAALLLTWLALTLALGVAADRRGVRAALRVGGLAMLWVLPMLLVAARLQPSRLAEIALVVAGAFALGALTDRLVPWPRGPLLPAAVAVVSYSTDLAFGSPLIIRSLLGVNPRSGARFYGLGNELEAALAVLLLVGLAALLWGRGRSRAAAAAFAVAGLVLGVFVGAGQLGADVGGVITVGAGVATATLLMLPGRVSRRRLVLAALVPLAALAALAALDLATGGNGHFTRAVLHADSARALLDVVQRRYTLAFKILTRGAMPLVTVVGALAVAYALRHRERIYAPLHDSASWQAAMIGGLTASVVGALSNDSGPVLFVYGLLILSAATAYVRGAPALLAAEDRIT